MLLVMQPARYKPCCLSPSALSPPQRCRVGGKSRTSGGGRGPGVPAGLKGTGKGKAVLLIQHGGMAVAVP